MRQVTSAPILTDHTDEDPQPIAEPRKKTLREAVVERVGWTFYNTV